MRDRMDKEKKEKRPLEGYKKKGKILTPPALQISGNHQMVSYGKQGVPQLLWWDLLIWNSSIETAILICNVFVNFFVRYKKDKPIWGVFISDYFSLENDEIDILKHNLKENQFFEIVVKSIQDFIILYPECPLVKLLDNPVKMASPDTQYIKAFKNRIQELFNKESKSAIMMQSLCIYMGFRLKKLHFSSSIPFDKFAQIADYPDSEISLHIASLVRATVIALLGQFLPPYPLDTWSQYFLQRGVELEPLNFEYFEQLCS
jgi:hypothetical protein